MNETHQFLGASVDGLMIVKGHFFADKEPLCRTVVLEIKSKVSESTAMDAEQYKITQRIKSFNYVRVSLANRRTTFPEFRKCIPDPDHCAQILQHCLCLGQKYCLYTVAKCSKIIYTVLVHFNTSVLRAYETVITDTVYVFIPFLTDLTKLPHYTDSDSWGYATSREVAMQQLQLREQFVQMVKDRGCPFPELFKLAPGICKVHLMFIPRLSFIGTTLLIYVSFFCLHTTQPLFVVGIGLRLVLMDLAII